MNNGQIQPLSYHFHIQDCLKLDFLIEKVVLNPNHGDPVPTTQNSADNKRAFA